MPKYEFFKTIKWDKGERPTEFLNLDSKRMTLIKFSKENVKK